MISLSLSILVFSYLQLFSFVFYVFLYIFSSLIISLFISLNSSVLALCLLSFSISKENWSQISNWEWVLSNHRRRNQRLDHEHFFPPNEIELSFVQRSLYKRFSAFAITRSNSSAFRRMKPFWSSRVQYFLLVFGRWQWLIMARYAFDAHRSCPIQLCLFLYLKTGHSRPLFLYFHIFKS